MLRETRNSINNHTLRLFLQSDWFCVAKVQFAIYTYLTIIFVCIFIALSLKYYTRFTNLNFTSKSIYP